MSSSAVADYRPPSKRVKRDSIPPSPRTNASTQRPTLTCGPFCQCVPLPDGRHPRVKTVLKNWWPKPHYRRHEAFDRQELVALRRHFHRHPELSYKEKNTAAKIVKVLTEHSSGCDDKDVKIVTKVDNTFGLWCDVSFGNGEGPFVMIRADMDALPIEESGKKTPYRSQIPGVSHACGHDGHMAILLTVGKVLMSDSYRAKSGSKLSGRIRLLFQPAEEGGAGAKRMIAGGCLAGIDRVYGLHLWNHQLLQEV